MNIEKGDKPSLSKKESNQVNLILRDTPEKVKEKCQVIAEDENDSISFDTV